MMVTRKQYDIYNAIQTLEGKCRWLQVHYLNTYKCDMADMSMNDAGEPVIDIDLTADTPVAIPSFDKTDIDNAFRNSFYVSIDAGVKSTTCRLCGNNELKGSGAVHECPILQQNNDEEERWLYDEVEATRYLKNANAMIEEFFRIKFTSSEGKALTTFVKQAYQSLMRLHFYDNTERIGQIIEIFQDVAILAWNFQDSQKMVAMAHDILADFGIYVFPETDNSATNYESEEDFAEAVIDSLGKKSSLSVINTHIGLVTFSDFQIINPEPDKT